MRGAIVIEGHVQGLSNTRSIGEMGVPVYVIDVARCLAQYSKYCTKFFRCPSFGSAEFVQFLVKLAERENLSGWVLVPSNDHIVENLSLNYDVLSVYYKMMVPRKEKLYDIINKMRLLNVAKNCGTSIPLSCCASEIEVAQSFRFPTLVKGSLGLSFYKSLHAKALQADDYVQLLELVSDVKGKIPLEDVMVQELIPEDKNDKVVSFTCFAIDGVIKSYWMGRKLREHPVKYGTATFAESVFVPEILVEARPLISALGYSGVCEVEFMFDNRDNKYKLIEINPRTWLWVGLAKACGVDYAKMIYNYLDGSELIFPEHYQTDVAWINAITDFAFSTKPLLKGQIRLKEYLRSIRVRKVHAVWSKKDILPGLIFPFMTFYIAKKRK